MQLNTNTTALVLIDLQKGVLARPLLPHPATTLYPRSKELASRLRGDIACSIDVESTARNAWEHGYELVLCEDLCSDLSEETHAHSFKYTFPRLARVVNWESITFE